MACKCEVISRSYDGSPFVPPQGSVNDINWQCPLCNQMWMQFNTYYHLWQKVTLEEWEHFKKDMRCGAGWY